MHWRRKLGLDPKKVNDINRISTSKIHLEFALVPSAPHDQKKCPRDESEDEKLLNISCLTGGRPRAKSLILLEN